jgi:hypothetical protein
MLILVVTVLYIRDEMVICRVQLIAAPGVHDFFDVEGAPAYVVSADRFLRLLP